MQLQMLSVCAANSACSLFVLFFVVVSIDLIKTGLKFVENLLVGILEGFLQSSSKSLESGRSSGLLLALLGCDSSLLEGFGSGSGGLLGSSSEGLGGWVESLHLDSVLEWVLLALVAHVLSDSLLSEHGLHLVGVNDSGEVSDGHLWSSELESALDNGLLSVGSKDLVELLEGILGEDNESSEVTTWSKLEEVKSGDIASVNSWEVSGGSLDDWVLIGVDDQRSLTESETSGSHLSLSWSHSLGFAGTGEIIGESEVLKSLEHTLGGVGLEGVNNEWEFWDGVNLVASGLDERSTGSSGESRCNSISLLVEVDLSVPLSPDLEWGKHASLTAHVTEGGLTGSVGTGSRDSWDSCYGTTSSPGFGGVLVSSMPENSVSLSSVLGHVGVAELDKVISDWSSEDSWHWGAILDSIGVAGIDAHSWTGSHLFSL